MVDDRAAERFWAKVEVGEPGDCWPWTGCKTDRGYGTFWLDGKMRQATHVSWALVHKAMPPPFLVVRHRCDTPICVNPSHLQIGTFSQNTIEAYRRGRKPFPLREESPYAPLLRWVNSRILAALDGFD